MRFAVLGLASLLAAVGTASVASAREGFYIGAGLESASSTGDFNGTTTMVDSSGTETIVAGKPGDTGGLNVMIGYGFNPYIAIEVDLISTGGIGSANVSGFPTNVSDELDIFQLGARLTYPATEHLDLFARLGVASATYWFGSLRTTNLGAVGVQPGGVAYYGGGLATGIGAEYFYKNVGFGLGLTQYGLTFDQSSAPGLSALPNRLNETVDAVDFIVAYHFPPWP